MRLALMILLFIVNGGLIAQDLNDPKLDPGLRVWFESREAVPVMVRVEGTISDARDYWRALRRSLGSRHGEVGGIPNENREFFAIVSSYGLALLLASEEVVEIYRPFEMTFPGETRGEDATGQRSGEFAGTP
jgi:hypothetical protein